MRRSFIALAAGAALLAAGLGFGRASAQPRAPSGLGLGMTQPAHALAAGARDRLAALAAERAEGERRARALRAAVRAMPDLVQTDAELGLGRAANSYCGPVAVSNGLVWLSEHGYEGVLPAGDTQRARQLAVVRALGSSRYMGTSANAGTGAGGMLTGLQRYLRHAGYKPRRLQYQGWRGHPQKFSTGEKFPNVAFLREALAEGGVAFLNVGWYQPSPRGGVWRRQGGHWLTVVGVDIAADGRAAPGTVVVHDPAPWAGDAPARHFARFAPLGEGWLIAEGGALPAAGHHFLEGDVMVKHDGDVAVVDGAIALVP